MKKLIPATLLALTLLLSACASAPTIAETAPPPIVEEVVQPAAPPPAATQEPIQLESNVLNADYENAVPVAMQLLLGTIQLEGTANAVTKEQAALLIPLWTNFKVLSESLRPAQGQGQPNATPEAADSGLQTQLDEIIEQIQSAMTAEQIQAIAAMQITQETSQAIMTEKGITLGGPQGGNGNMQGGGQPPAGGGMPQGGQQPDSAMGTPPADGMRQGGQGGMGFIPSELIDALLQLLAQK